MLRWLLTGLVLSAADAGVPTRDAGPRASHCPPLPTPGPRRASGFCPVNRDTFLELRRGYLARASRGRAARLTSLARAGHALVVVSGNGGEPAVLPVQPRLLEGALRLDTKFHSMKRAPSSGSPPSATTRAAVSAITVTSAPGDNTPSWCIERVWPSTPRSPETTQTPRRRDATVSRPGSAAPRR